MAVEAVGAAIRVASSTAVGVASGTAVGTTSGTAVGITGEIGGVVSNRARGTYIGTVFVG